jgi:hypothetical protein
LIKISRIYGPNEALRLLRISGEAMKERDAFLVHGGQQENYLNFNTIFNGGFLYINQWIKKTNPKLEKTYGCLRAWDQDMAILKEITDQLTADNPNDRMGYLIVKDDLDSWQQMDLDLKDLEQKENETHNFFDHLHYKQSTVGRLYEGDPFYEGSYWQIYDETRKW